MFDTMRTFFNRHHFIRITLLIIFFFCGSLLTACEQRQQTTAAEPQPKKPVYEGTIIALGDSLTAGLGVATEDAFPALLENKLQKNGHNWRVINAGISGETSSGALSRINWIAAQRPDIVILETGANDGFRGIPPYLVKDNIRKSIRLLKEKNIFVVLAGMQIVRNLGAEYTKDFAALYPAIAKEENVTFIPFFLKDVAGNASLNQADTIHPTPEGYKIVAETVYPYVLKAIESRNSR